MHTYFGVRRLVAAFLWAPSLHFPRGSLIAVSFYVRLCTAHRYFGVRGLVAAFLWAPGLKFPRCSFIAVALFARPAPRTGILECGDWSPLFFGPRVSIFRGAVL